MGKTWRDVARREVMKRECLYFADVLAELRHRIRREARPLFAATCAERLLTRHLALRAADQRPFTVGWRSPLNSLWQALESPETGDAAPVKRALQTFREGNLNHSDGQDGPDDADHDPAAACIYAAEAYLNPNEDFAFWAASRVVDEAFSRVEAQQEATHADGISELVEECCHPIVQRALGWLLTLASLVEASPLDRKTVGDARMHAVNG